MKYSYIDCKSALNKVKGRFPYTWDLNIYRGCSHACNYCFAMYTHKYVNSSCFFDDIYIKRNIVDLFEKELSSKKWKQEVINIGGITDSYQAIEAKCKIMPDILKLLIKYKTPTIISTKSTLILRDLDLISELANLTYVNIASTITVMDERLRKKIEPGAASSIKRFEMLKEFTKTNCVVGVHAMPIIPLITDTEENIDQLFCHAHDSNVNYILPGTLYLMGTTKIHFFHFVKKEFPFYYNSLIKLYKNGGLNKEYKIRFYQMINEMKKKYMLSSNYMKFVKAKLPSKEEPMQLSFFDV